MVNGCDEMFPSSGKGCFSLGPFLDKQLGCKSKKV